MNEQVTEANRLVDEEIERKSAALKGAVAVGARAIGKHYPPKLAASLLAIQKAIGKIENDKQNTQFGFGYQSIGNVIEHLNPLLNEHGIGIVQSELGVAAAADNENMLAVTYEFTIFNELGDVWPDRPRRTGLASIWSRAPKGTQEGAVDPLAINKAESQAYKFFVKRMFAVRAGDALPDNDGDTGEIPPAKRTEAVLPEQSGRTSTRGRKPKMGEPRLILVKDAGKLSNVEAGKLWLSYFQSAINQSETREEAAKWCELNNDMLLRLGAVVDAKGTKVGETWLQDARTCVAQRMKELIEADTKPAEITSGPQPAVDPAVETARIEAEQSAKLAAAKAKVAPAPIDPEAGKTAAVVAETAAKAAMDFDDLAIPEALKREPAKPLTYEQMRDKVVSELEKGMSLEAFADYKVGLAEWIAALEPALVENINAILNKFLLVFWEAETAEMITHGSNHNSQQQLATVKTANLLPYKEEVVKLNVEVWNRVVQHYTEAVHAVQAALASGKA